MEKYNISLRRFLYYFITLAALIVIYAKISDFSLLKQIFLKSNLFWLLGILISQYFSYHFLALNYREVLKVKNLSVDVRKLFPITFVIQFLNQALPSATISGQVFFIQYLKEYGLSVAEGIGRAIIELITLVVALGAFFLVSTVLLFRQNIWAAHPELEYVIYLFVFLGIIFSIIFLALQKKKRGFIVQWIIGKLHRYFESKNQKENKSHVASLFDQLRTSVNIGELRKRSKPFWWAVLWQGAGLLMNVLTLYFVGLALSFHLLFVVAFVTFILTKFVSMVSFVPGAFGVFEGVMTLILISFDVPAGIALAVTISFRAFTFWLPMPIGWMLYRKYINQTESVENS